MAEHTDTPEPSDRPTVVAWDRPDHLVTFDIGEVARRAGHHRWIANRLFELLGSWATTVSEVAIKHRLGVHAHRLAWHAELWRDRLPELAEMSPDTMTTAPDDVRRAVDAAAAPSGTGQTLERLVGVYRVLIPRQLAAYRFQQAHTSTITDGPTARTLSLALADLVEIWTDGEMLVQSLLRTDSDVRRAADHQVAVERAITSAGGMCGPGSIG